MEQEFQLLNDKFQAWEIVPCLEAKSQGKNILGTTWALSGSAIPMDACEG